MRNIVDYVQSVQRTLEEMPFTGVDSLVLSTASYYRFDGLVKGLEFADSVSLGSLIESNAEALMQKHGDPKPRQALLEALQSSPRFRDFRLMGYENRFDEEKQEQFSAITFLMPDNTAYVAYRGTDNTLVGWKEDFNMTYLCPVPAQEASVKYLHRVAQHLPPVLRVGGHSKGGNLAAYAALSCDDAYRARIGQVYNHDGPGFSQQMLQSDGYKAIEQRVKLYVPQSSVVGMLLYQKGEYSVVESNKFWILQHDPFAWEVEDDDFRYAEKLSNSSVHLNDSLDKWLAGISMEQRELFVDSIYRVIEAANVDTLDEFKQNWRMNAVEALSALKAIDPGTRKFLRQTISALFFAQSEWQKKLYAKLDQSVDKLREFSKRIPKLANRDEEAESDATLEQNYLRLTKMLSQSQGVQSVGKSGGKTLPSSHDDGDIDLFLYCTAIPNKKVRERVLLNLSDSLSDIRIGVSTGDRWGTCDCASICGVDTWMMYFTQKDAAAEADEILCGEQMDRQGEFYPSGRMAMYTGMDILVDKSGFLSGMRERVLNCPANLYTKLTNYHLNALSDTEDLKRAVARRDVLFYHFALDNALDHFLQALFALNSVFFPSRKRSEEWIVGFPKKPEDCADRLRKTLRLAGNDRTLDNSYVVFSELVRDLLDLASLKETMIE